MAISLAVDSQQKSIMAVFLTDALSVLQALTNNTLPHLANALQLLSNNCRVALQWIPAHCGVPGNEQADTLAKQGAQTATSNQVLIWATKKRPPLPKRLWFQVKRRVPEQVIMTRLRTEHNRWYAHMHKKLQMVLSADCPFGEEDWQTTEHILQNCKGHDQERYTAWLTETTLLSENTWWRTTEFILVTGLTV